MLEGLDYFILIQLTRRLLQIGSKFNFFLVDLWPIWTVQLNFFLLLSSSLWRHQRLFHLPVLLPLSYFILFTLSGCRVILPVNCVKAEWPSVSTKSMWSETPGQLSQCWVRNHVNWVNAEFIYFKKFVEFADIFNISVIAHLHIWHRFCVTLT